MVYESGLFFYTNRLAVLNFMYESAPKKMPATSIMQQALHFFTLTNVKAHCTYLRWCMTIYFFPLL